MNSISYSDKLYFCGILKCIKYLRNSMYLDAFVSILQIIEEQTSKLSRMVKMLQGHHKQSLEYVERNPRHGVHVFGGTLLKSWKCYMTRCFGSHAAGLYSSNRRLKWNKGSARTLFLISGNQTSWFRSFDCKDWFKKYLHMQPFKHFCAKGDTYIWNWNCSCLEHEIYTLLSSWWSHHAQETSLEHSPRKTHLCLKLYTSLPTRTLKIR